MADEQPEIELLAPETKERWTKRYKVFLDHVMELWRGIKSNPSALILGLCPAIAVTSSLDNALFMSLALAFTLVISAAVIFFIRRFIDSHHRLFYLLITTTAVTVFALILQARNPIQQFELGIYLPLVAVNCLIMARLEMKRDTFAKTFLDSLGFSAGFAIILMPISILREVLGTSRLLYFGHLLLQLPFQKFPIFLLAPGAFFAASLITALYKVKKHD